MTGIWYKKDDGDKVWWLDIQDNIGTMVFSFDRKKKFYLFRDYPYKLTKQEKEIFDKDQPFWADFFRGRK